MSKPRKRTYAPVPKYTVQQVERAVARGNLNVLRSAAYAVPWHWIDWKAAQRFCAHLSNYQDEITRGNALLGLSYLARFHKRLDRKGAATILLRALKDPKKSVRERARDAIQDVNYLMKWKIGNIK